MSDKMPPGASQGIVAGEELAGHKQGATTTSGLDGVTPKNIAAVAPKRMSVRPDGPAAAFVLGDTPD